MINNILQHHYNTENNTTPTSIIQQQQQQTQSNVVSFYRNLAHVLIQKPCCNVVFTSENHVVLALHHGVSVVFGQPLPSIDSQTQSFRQWCRKFYQNSHTTRRRSRVNLVQELTPFTQLSNLLLHDGLVLWERNSRSKYEVKLCH
jgi:hypothetical protein